MSQSAIALRNAIAGLIVYVPHADRVAALSDVLEATEDSDVGHCDNCSKFNFLRHGECSSGEYSVCKWGCDK